MKKILSSTLIFAFIAASIQAEDLENHVYYQRKTSGEEELPSNTDELEKLEKEIQILEHALRNAKQDAGGRWKIYLSSDELMILGTATGASGGLVFIKQIMSNKVGPKPMLATALVTVALVGESITADLNGNGLILARSTKQIEEISEFVQKAKRDLKIAKARKEKADRLAAAQARYKSTDAYIQEAREKNLPKHAKESSAGVLKEELIK